MAMPRQTQELLLTGGLDRKEHEEAEGPSGFRVLDGFRFGETGKLERTPAEAAGVSTVLPGYTTESDYPHTLFSRGNDIAFLTRERGVGRFAEGYSAALVRQEEFQSGVVASEPSKAFNPLPCSVSRMALHGVQPGWAIGATTACKTPYGNFVIAWVETNVGGINSDTLHMRAYTPGGTLLCEADVKELVSTSSAYVLKSCERNGATEKGAYISFQEDGGAAPYTASIYYYEDNGEDPGDFQFSHSMTNIGTVTHTIADAAYGSGDPYFYFLYQDNTTGFLTVRRVLSAVTQPLVHSGNHAFGGACIVKGTNATVIFSYSTSAVLSEELGDPSTDTIITNGGSESYGGITAAFAKHEGHTDAADVFIRSDTLSQFRTRTVVASVEFDGAASLIASHAEPNAHPITEATSYAGRSYCGLSVDGNAVVLASPRNTTAGANIDPVARMFHSRAALPTGGYGSVLASWEHDGSIYTASQCDNNTTLMVCKVDMADKCPPLRWVDVNGVTALSGGLLFEYDGSHVTESQPMHAPKVSQVTSGGGAAISVKAVYSWVDASGALHRSAPSAALVTTINSDLKVMVPSFLSYDNSAMREVGTTLYATAAGGTIHYETTSLHTVDAFNQYYTFSSVQAGASSSAALYTEGGELESEPPPAMHDVSIVGDRMVGVNAEDRFEWWASKTFREGYGIEWNTLLRGRLMDQIEAVVELNGLVTFLGRTAVWVLYGDGPNNAGAGTFAPPRKVAEVGCVGRESVVRVASGVMFQSDRGIVMLDTGFNVTNIGLPVEPEVSPRKFRVRRAVYDHANEEVRFFGHNVATDFSAAITETIDYYYSLRSSAWSKLTRTTSGDGLVFDAMVSNGRIWLAKDDETVCKELDRFDTDYNSRAGDSTWEMPWIKADGLTGYSKMWSFLLALKTPSEDLSSNCTVTITMYADFDPNTIVSQWIYTGTEMQNWITSGVEWLRLRPANQRLVAYKLKCEVTGSLVHSGIIPLAIRQEYGVDPNGRRRIKKSRRTAVLQPTVTVTSP